MGAKIRHPPQRDVGAAEIDVFKLLECRQVAQAIVRDDRVTQVETFEAREIGHVNERGVGNLGARQSQIMNVSKRLKTYKLFVELRVDTVREVDPRDKGVARNEPMRRLLSGDLFLLHHVVESPCPEDGSTELL